MRDGRVELAWGLTGAADVQRDRAREESRVVLQSELDLLRAQHTRRRDWVLAMLRESTATLADVSHGLREG